MNRIRGKEIAMIFQEPMTALNPVFTVGEQIGETLRVHDGLGRGGSARARPAAADAGRHRQPRRSGSTSTRTSCPAECASAS